VVVCGCGARRAAHDLPGRCTRGGSTRPWSAEPQLWPCRRRRCV
jgi:hypothetical protein